VERLSTHLGARDRDLRRALIEYSLYTRQLDLVQERASKDFCRDLCDRPPVGCCNADHFRVHSLSDCLFARPTGLSMRLASAIGGLQGSEDRFSMGQGLVRTPGYCALLTDRGCTLRLFKSPHCAHYLCPSAGAELTRQYGGAGGAFVAAMGRAAGCTLSCRADFTHPEVLELAEAMFQAEGGTG
jgi:hypothetical protein